MPTLIRRRGLSWDDPGKSSLGLFFVLALILALIAPIAANASETDDTVQVVVRETAPSTSDAENLVDGLGGTVDTRLDLIGGFVATIPSGSLAALQASPAIASATPDGRVELLGYRRHSDWGDSSYTSYSTLYVANQIAATSYWNAGFLGQGVDVALIDSGVVPVNGLTFPGKVINGPDLSFESQSTSYRYLDTYGHGTHMAGIIAGRDNAVTFNPTNLLSYNYSYSEDDGFVGIAPAARVVSVKVAGYDGATDVSQIIAAIDWVVQHRRDPGLNIRVLNLSFGTDGVQSYQLDPLAFAIEQAWKAGIVAVVSAGNDGSSQPLRNPAYDPFVIAVGATDTLGTRWVSDNVVTDFSNCGTGSRTVDLVAPGKSIRSLRNPGSTADLEAPSARVDDRFFKGTGTSQAAAVTSGAAALVISQHPRITPDQVKALLMSSAEHLDNASATCQGAGELDLRNALYSYVPSAVQKFPSATGVGSLEASRGTDHVETDGVALTGERDIFGSPFDGASWSTAAAAGASWSGGTWNGASWSGASWSGASWSGASWSGASWSGASWSGASWSSIIWSGASWSGASWSGASWSGTSWAGASWSGASWTGLHASVRGELWD